MQYKIRNGMLTLLFDMKHLMAFFKVDMHYVIMAFLFEGHSAILIFDSELHPTIAICKASFGMRSDSFYYGRHSSKIIPLP